MILAAQTGELRSHWIKCLQNSDEESCEVIQESGANLQGIFVGTTLQSDLQLQRNETVTPKVQVRPEVCIDGKQLEVVDILRVSPSTSLTDHAVAVEAKQLLKQYLGLTPIFEPQLQLEWQVKVSTQNITVETSMVPASTWQAIRSKSYIRADREQIVSFLLDDTRIGEIDDMLAGYEVRKFYRDEFQMREIENSHNIITINIVIVTTTLCLSAVIQDR